MIIDSLRIDQNKPPAFQNRSDIKYLHIRFHHIDLINWGKLKGRNELSNTSRDIEGYMFFIRFYIFKKFPCTSRITVSIPSRILTDGWFISGGAYKVK